MSAHDILIQRQAERNALLQRALTLLEGDQRIVAAWLYGSLGRADADEWSDIDLWLVAADEYTDDLLAERYEMVARVGEPLIVLNVPPNAPQGGAFMSVVYSGVGGPQHMDWTWQPQSSATVPPGVHMLFDHAGITPRQQRDQTPEQRLQRAVEQTTFFWMMVHIVASYIARRDAWKVTALLAMLHGVLDEIRSLTAQATAEPGRPGRNEGSVPPTKPGEQLEMLRRMAGEIETVMAATVGLDMAVSRQVRREIYGFLGLVSEVL